VRDLSGDEAGAALAQAFTWPLPQILGYHHISYQILLTSILGDDMRCLVAERADHGLCGVMPYREVESAQGRVLNALPFFGCTGLIATSPHDTNVMTLLLDAFRRTARRDDVFSASLYSPFYLNTTRWVEHLGADDVVVKFTQWLDLDGTTSWPAKRRGDLRRAAERGFSVRDGDPSDADRIVDIYGENCRAAGIPMKPRRFIEGTLDIGARGGANAPLQWLVAEHGAELRAALLYARGPITGSYVLPCVSAGERPYQPTALLIDAAISRSRGAGTRYWNFESSPVWDDPVFQYKARWGARALPFAIFVFYGARGRIPTAEDVATVRQSCPYYFIAPTGQITGAWPTHLPLPPEYAGLQRYVRGSMAAASA
jgi:hypothetical protein